MHANYAIGYSVKQEKCALKIELPCCSKYAQIVNRKIRSALVARLDAFGRKQRIEIRLEPSARAQLVLAEHVKSSGADGGRGAQAEVEVARAVRLCNAHA